MNITSGITYRYQDGLFLLREHVFSFTCTLIRGTSIGKYSGNYFASSFQPYSGLNDILSAERFLPQSSVKPAYIHRTSERRGYISGLSKLAPTKNKLFPLLFLNFTKPLDTY